MSETEQEGGAAPEPTAAERGVIDRRAAMKAALGGAVAAAAWTAPRIEHFSVAPDFAQAATCLPATGSVTRTSTVCDAAVIGFTSECYGNCIGIGLIDCGAASVTYPTATTGSFPPGVTMTVVYDGFAEGSLPPGEGTATVTVNGIRSPSQTCNVTGTHAGCRNSIGSGGRAPTSVSPNPLGPYTSTLPGPRSTNMGCYNLVGSNRQRVTFTLTLACTCAA